MWVGTGQRSSEEGGVYILFYLSNLLNLVISHQTAMERTSNDQIATRPLDGFRGTLSETGRKGLFERRRRLWIMLTYFFVTHNTLWLSLCPLTNSLSVWVLNEELKRHIVTRPQTDFFSKLVLNSGTASTENNKKKRNKSVHHQKASRYSFHCSVLLKLCLDTTTLLLLSNKAVTMDPHHHNTVVAAAMDSNNLKANITALHLNRVDITSQGKADEKPIR